MLKDGATVYCTTCHEHIAEVGSLGCHFAKTKSSKGTCHRFSCVIKAVFGARIGHIVTNVRTGGHTSQVI